MSKTTLNYLYARHCISSTLLGLVLATSFSGCKQEQLDQLAKQVKEATVEKLEQVAGPIKLISSGSMKLDISGPIETSTAYARLIVIGDGRSNVLQIRSYKDMGEEEYPKVLIQANTKVTELSQIQGSALNATVYVTASKYLPIWSCMDQSTATITITGIQDGLLKATVRCDKMISTEDKSSPLSGTIEALIPTPSVASNSERLVK